MKTEGRRENYTSCTTSKQLLKFDQIIGLCHGNCWDYVGYECIMLHLTHMVNEQCRVPCRVTLESDSIGG